MSRRKRSQKLKVFLIILIVAAIVGLAFLVWAIFFKDKDNNSTLSDGQSVVVNTIDENNSNDSNMDNLVVRTGEGDKKVVQFDGEDPNENDELSGVVTFAGVSPDGDKLMVRVNIDQFLENGKCVGYIYNGDDSVIYESEVGIEASASTSTCKGFDISTDGLGTGKKKIVIKLESNGKTGKIVGEADI